MRLKIMIIMVLCYGTLSCNKEGDDNYTHIHHPLITHPTYYDTTINQYLLDGYLFDKGTYWIYKDSMTGIIDTCIVDSTVMYKPVIVGNNCVYWLKIAYNIKTGLFPCECILVGNKLYVHYNNPNNYSDNILLDSVNDSGVFYLDDKDTFFPYYIIDTATYLEVYKIFYKKSIPPWPEQVPDSGYYYLKSGIGIIKSEYYIDGQKSVFEIIDYHIQ